MTRKVNRYSQIGLDRLVRLEWLERTASLVLAGNSELVIKETLQHEISGSFRTKDTSVCGSINKTIKVLHQVWVSPPIELKIINKAGLDLLTRLPSKYHIAVHWGMIMSAYPFWANVAIQTGRLLRLQSNVTSVQVQRRIREQYGERETVARRARYVLRSFVSWGVLVETEKKGLYKTSVPLAIENQELMLWLAEAYLFSQQNSSIPANELFGSPAYYPFRFKTGNLESLIMKSDRLEIIKHSLDAINVKLKK
jgi:hypothetical protein